MPAGTTKEQVEADFDKLWLRFDNAGLTDREYAELTAESSASIVSSAIGMTAGSTAPDNIDKGELFIAKGVAYVAINNIPRGATLTEGVNVRKTTVTEYVAAIAKEG